MEDCPLCGQAPENVEAEGPILTVTCPRCGEFRVRREFADRIRDYAAGELPGARDRIKRWGENRHLISGWVRERTDVGDDPLDLTEDRLDAVVQAAPKRVDERLSRLLLNLKDRSDFLGDHFEVDPETDYPLGYCRNSQEFTTGLQALKKYGYLEIPAMGHVSITYAGWRQIEELSESGARSVQAFVAMKFDDEMHEVYDEAISDAVEAAGYSPLNMSRLEHVDPIDARILEEIDRSRFLIADVTGANQGVYFEAGYALGQGIPVIWSCRDPEFPEDAHFDVEHFNHIVWDDLDEFGEDLRARIVAVIGEGPGV